MAPGASLYLVGPMSLDERLEDFFFDPSDFSAALRLRLGLSTQASGGICSLCDTHAADTSGHNALTCMHGGYRTRAHNALRDMLISILRDCLLQTTAESHPFATDPGAKLDATAHFGGRQQLIDTAIAHALADANRLAAAASPGGCATAYENGKHVLPTQKLVPFVVDSFGALSASARELLRTVIPLFARHQGLSTSVASRIVTGRITSCVVRWMARIASIPNAVTVTTGRTDSIVVNSANINIAHSQP